MKKNTNLSYLLVIALFFVVNSTANAQFRIGVKGEVGTNKMSFDNEVLSKSNLTSYKIGPVFEIQFPQTGFAIESGVLYSSDKTTIEEWGDSGIGSLTGKAEIRYLDVPLNLKYKFDFILGFYLAAGPYVQFHLEDNDFFDNFKDDLKSKKFVGGINLGGGVEIFKTISVGVNYSVNMTDNYSVHKPEWEDAFNRDKGLWSLTAAIYF